MRLEINEDDRTILRTLLEGAQVMNDEELRLARQYNFPRRLRAAQQYNGKLEELMLRLDGLEEAESTDTVSKTEAA